MSECDFGWTVDLKTGFGGGEGKGITLKQPDAHYVETLAEAVEALRRAFAASPRLAFVLGSGIMPDDSLLQTTKSVPYAALPGFPESGVKGHPGRLSVRRAGQETILCLEGRSHLYEGFTAAEVTLPVRAIALFGVDTVVLLNAAGAVNPKLVPGDLMLISDHMNLMGESPAAGCGNALLGERFVDLSSAYNPGLRALAVEAAADCGFALLEGIYAGVRGPNYETPAEVKMLRALGADAVGMSTIPEVIALNQLNRSVVALSCITNMGAGISSAPLSHAEVLETGRRMSAKINRWILEYARRFGESGA